MGRIATGLGAALCAWFLAGPARAGVEITEVLYAPRITGSHGLLQAQDGTIYLSDSYAGTDKIYRIVDGGREEVAAGFSTPAGLWQDGQGRFYVCDVNASLLYRFSSQWILDRTWSVENPWNIVFAPDGGIYVATYQDTIYRIDGETVSAIWTGLEHPFGIALDGAGNLYVAEHTAGRIARRTAAGETSIFASGLSQPEGLRWGPDDRLWMADTLEGVLYRFEPDGTPRAVDPGGLDFSFAVNLTQVRDRELHLGCAGGNGRIYRLSWTEETPSPTPATPQPTWSPAPTVTVRPTATPIPPLGVDLVLTTTRIHPGEEFGLEAILTNPGGPRTGMPLAVVLEVADRFWFWPAWTLFDPVTGAGLDWDPVDLPTGALGMTVLPAFLWPDTGSDGAENLWFHGLLLTPDLASILGSPDSEEWAYGPP